MILIFSEQSDISTNYVMDCLLYKYSKDVIRINENDTLHLENVTINKDKVSIRLSKNGENIFNINEIKAMWYRRGGLNIARDYMPKSSELEEQIAQAINMHISSESHALIEFIKFYLLTEVRCLGSFYDVPMNKLKGLMMAKRSGLNIPNTWVLNHGKKVARLLSRNHELITKAISENISPRYNNIDYMAYTESISPKHINKSSFYPSLFQEKINKQFELRIFYIKELLYAIAIFSQAQQLTNIDSRKVSDERPLRAVPYTLPSHLEIKVKNFMKLCCLDSGSIDMCVTPQNQYVFLEVNPIGQFGMLSMQGNYNIYGVIAKYLIGEDMVEASPRLQNI